MEADDRLPIASGSLDGAGGGEAETTTMSEGEVGPVMDSPLLIPARELIRRGGDDEARELSPSSSTSSTSSTSSVSDPSEMYLIERAMTDEPLAHATSWGEAIQRVLRPAN
jgi:hypothetical protein